MAGRTAAHATIAVLVLLGLTAWPAFAQEPPVPTARPDTAQTPADNPPIPSPRPETEPQKLNLGDGVTAQFDIAYTTPPGASPLTLDLYVPRPHPQPLPLVLFIHDGDWNSGDSRHAAPFKDLPRSLAALAAQGYVVASVNYRLSAQAPFPAALQDVKSAIRWLRGHASSHGGDATRLAVWGLSAGGHLAAMAGTSCGVMGFEPKGDTEADAPSDCAEAVIDWYGPTNLQSLAADSGQPDGDVLAAAKFLGCDPKACAPAVVQQTNPLTFITVHGPPFLIQQGTDDTIVSPKQSQKLYAALTAQGVPAELVLYPDVGHDFARKGETDGAVVTKAMAKVSTFLAANFPNKPPAKKVLKKK
jgi:acetyl esterase/lipase